MSFSAKQKELFFVDTCIKGKYLCCIALAQQHIHRSFRETICEPVRKTLMSYCLGWNIKHDGMCCPLSTGCGRGRCSAVSRKEVRMCVPLVLHHCRASATRVACGDEDTACHAVDWSTCSHVPHTCHCATVTTVASESAVR